jgi:hypothetical protein
MIAFEPQSITADTINRGLLHVWKGNRVQCLLQVHDSILVQYPEHLESEIVPWLINQVEQPVILRDNRSFTIPAEAQVGWNWAYANEHNPDGLKKWAGKDRRTRTSSPKAPILGGREHPIASLVEEIDT